MIALRQLWSKSMRSALHCWSTDGDWEDDMDSAVIINPQQLYDTPLALLGVHGGYCYAGISVRMIDT